MRNLSDRCCILAGTHRAAMYGARGAPDNRRIRGDPQCDMKRRATVICERDGRVLLVAREQGRWAFPGGRQKAGEDIAETAARELIEETHLAPRRIQYLFQFHGTRTRHFVFVARLDDDAFPVPGNEIVRCQWMRLEAVRRLDASVSTRGIAEIFLKHARSSHGRELSHTLDALVVP